MIAEAEIRRYAAQWGVDPMVVAAILGQALDVVVGVVRGG